MSEQLALHLGSEAMLTAAKIAAPILLASMLVGLVISLLQSVTMVQEVTLTFVPKVVVIGLVIAVSGHWMLSQFVGFVHQLFAGLPQLLGSG